MKNHSASPLLLAGALALGITVTISAVLFASTPARATNSAPAIEAFNAAFSKVNDYTFDLHAHEIQGTDVQDRVYHYWFMKPHFAKTLIASGPGRGSGGVWTGGDQVSGHQGGLLSGIHLKVDLHDGRAVSLRGYTIPDGLLQNIVERFVDTPGTLSQAPGGKLDGVDTDRLDLKIADPTKNGGITEQLLYLSQETHFPVRQILYQDKTIVLDQTFADIKTNNGLSQNDFPY